MRSATLSSPLLSRLLNRGWTCVKCQHTRVQPPCIRLPTGSGPRRTYSSSSSYSNANPNAKPRWPRRRVLWAATGGTAAVATGGTVLALSDEMRVPYEAVARTGRVASVLFICINDYRKTLDARDKTEDEDERSILLKTCHKRCADRTLKVLEKNGGIFIKLGQHLSAMNYLLPAEWTTTFVPLQDKCPVSSFESIERMFRKDTGQDIWEHFSDFASEPIGAASLAQVHLATIKATGQKVAVKVQHPELAQYAPLDMSLTKFTFSTLKRFFPEYDLEWLSSEMELSLPQELDFTREAENACRTRDHFARLPQQLPLVVPDVLWARKRILVMAQESGHRLDDLAYLDAHGIDRDEVSATLARVFNEMIFGEGAPLHCDPHGGNIAIRKNEKRGRGKANFDLVLYDHGLYRDIPEALRRSYAKMWLAIIDGDVPRMKRYVKEVAGVDEDKFPLFASAITGREFSVVSAGGSGSILQPKTGSERDTMGSALVQDNLLADLVQLLGQVPRIILLILKTNDLTRSLDENLQTRRGPVRQFLILARYCMRTVLRERVEQIRERGSLLWPPNALRMVAAWWAFWRVEVKLEAFEARIEGCNRREWMYKDG